LHCLPHHLHRPFALYAAAGNHVLDEKRMAINEVEVQEMLAASLKAGVQLSIDQSSRCKKNAPIPSSTAKLARRKSSNPPDQKTILLYLPNQKY
jgi:hypothetical protein